MNDKQNTALLEQETAADSEITFKTPNRKKKPSVFARALLIYVCALAVFCICLLCVCWSALSQYESSQPKYVLEDMCEDFTPYLESALREVCADSIGEYESWDVVFRDVLAPAFAGEYTYKRNVREYTAQNPVYTVSCENDIANVTLEKAPETSSFGFAVWKVQKVDIIADLSGVSTITTDITVPVGATVKINGKTLNATPEKTVVYPFASKYEKDATLPEYAVYKVSGLYATPVIEATLDSTALVARDGNAAAFDLPASMLRDVTVTVPHGTQVKVGGILLSESEIADSAVAFADAVRYDNAHYVRYAVKGLVSKPTVEAYDTYGKRLDGVSEDSENNYTLGYRESDSHKLKVIYPTDDVTLTINGLDAKDIVSVSNVPSYQYTAGLTKYIDAPLSLGYVELERIYGSPEVKCIDSSGRELKSTVKESDGEVYYTFTPVPDDKLKAEYEKYAVAYTDDYIAYCSGGYQIVNRTFGVAASHLAPDSPAYEKLQSTKFSFGQNKAYKVSNKQITTYEYISLGENSFSCLVDFEMDVTTTYNVEQKTQHEKVEGMRLTFAKLNDSWKIVGLGM